MIKVAFGTVVYETDYNIYKEYIESINNQNNDNFDVLLLNDNLDNCDYISSYINKNIVWAHTRPNSTKSELRIELIKAAKQKKYDLLILGDFDDTFSANRVNEYILNFNIEYSLFYNNLSYLDTGREFFHQLPLAVRSIDPILECNFLGLSNTALNLHKIDIEMLDMINSMHPLIFDWLFFSLMLLQGHKGKIVNNCRTYYRIYERNTAGDIDTSIAGLKKEIDIKIAHYSKLIDYDFRYIELLKFYKEIKESFVKYSDLLLNNVTTNNRYWWGRINKNKIKEKMADVNKR